MISSDPRELVSWVNQVASYTGSLISSDPRELVVVIRSPGHRCLPISSENPPAELVVGESDCQLHRRSLISSDPRELVSWVNQIASYTVPHSFSYSRELVSWVNQIAKTHCAHSSLQTPAELVAVIHIASYTGAHSFLQTPASLSWVNEIASYTGADSSLQTPAKLVVGERVYCQLRATASRTARPRSGCETCPAHGVRYATSTQAPPFCELATAASINAIPVRPSTTFAYLLPSEANGFLARYARTSCSKQRCSRANASWNASGCPAGIVGSAIRSAGRSFRNPSLADTAPR